MKDTIPHLRQSPRLIGQRHPQLQVRQVLTKQKRNAVTESVYMKKTRGGENTNQGTETSSSNNSQGNAVVFFPRRSLRISEQLQLREVDIQKERDDLQGTRTSCSNNPQGNAVVSIHCREANLQRRQNAYNSMTETETKAHPKRRRDARKKTRGSDCSTNSQDIGTDGERSKKRPLEVDELPELHAEDREKIVSVGTNNGQRAETSKDQWCGIFTGAMEIDEENKKIALDAIESIQDKLAVIRGEEYRECTAVKRKLEKNACEERLVVIEQKSNKAMRHLYLERDEIFKSIPNFWLFAFLGHHALGDLFGEEDQKIFRFVNSMDVEDEEDVVSGYRITLKFNDNPYFTNRSLTKRITFCKDETTNLSAVEIDWKDGMAITTEYLHDMPDLDTGFFTWFCAPQVIRERYHDEVSELIKNELWPNALEYFVNGNESGEEDEQPNRRRGTTQKRS